MSTQLEILGAELATMQAAASLREKQVIDSFRQMDEMLKEVEQQRNKLRSNNELLASVSEFINRVMDTMAEVLILLGPDGKIKQVNQKLIDLLGYSREEVVGQFAEMFLAPPDVERLTAARGDMEGGIASDLYTLVSHHKRYEVEVELTHKNGETMSHLLRGTVLYGTQGKKEGIVVIGTDIREMKKLTRYLEREMQVAVKIQTAMLPEVPDHDTLEMAATMSPTAEVAGDYYDMVEGHDGCMWFGIGDVTGHGVTPGLVMMMAQTSFATLIGQPGPITPRDVIIAINRVIYKNVRHRLKNDEHMTLSILKYEGDGKFTYAGAHTDFVVHRKATGTCERIETAGLYVGILEDIEEVTENFEFGLELGDTLLLLTDGFTESLNPELGLLEYEGIIERLETNAHMDVQGLHDLLVKEALTWCNHMPDDDMSLVVIRRRK